VVGGSCVNTGEVGDAKYLFARPNAISTKEAELDYGLLNNMKAAYRDPYSF